MMSMVEPGSQAEQVGRLVLAVVVILFLPALPFGNYLIYPFSILTTWFHEMGHGMTAILMGQDFERLLIFADGSGVAESTLDGDAGAVTRAAIAAGGPLAPSVVGSVLILASSNQKYWRPALFTLAAIIAGSTLFYVRSGVGLAMLPLVGALIGLVAWRASDGLARFALQFLGVLAAMSMMRDFNYLFTERATIGGTSMLSDTGAIEEALFLPHWFWAAAIIIVSAVMIGASLKYALRDQRRPPRPPRNSNLRKPDNVLQFRDRRD
ncbi:MAG: M50 family metallopeptidase [Pseudomonadota bacterium]